MAFAQTVEKVLINEVGPRDGLQNQAKILTIEERSRLISSLLDAGLQAIEFGSFVSPKAVPAMAGSDEVFASLPEKAADYSVLIPNKRGYDTAVEAGVETISLVITTSDTMNEKNVRMTVDQSAEIFFDLIKQGQADGKKMIVCIGTAWECPFEGLISEDHTAQLVGRFFDANADEIVLADTIGAATPGQVNSLMARLASEYSPGRLSCHFHDTRGFGVANVYAALEAGIRKFDASVGGIGGCPFAPGASGNVATEDVVLMLEKMGYDTGIDLKKLVAAADLAGELTGVQTGGNSYKWIQRQLEKGLI